MPFSHGGSGERLARFVLLSLGIVLVGYASGLNSILTLSSFQLDVCDMPLPPRNATHAFPVTITCVDERAYRLVYIAGTVLGPLLSGFVVADSEGRKMAIGLGALMFIIGSAGMLLGTHSQSAVLLVLARGVQGIGTSALAFAIPLLWVESASAASRGRVGALMFAMIHVGLFAIAAVMTFDATEALRTEWMWLYLPTALLAFVVVVGVRLFVLESPRWRQLMDRKRGDADVESARVTVTNESTESLRDIHMAQRVGVATALLTLQQLFALINVVQLSDVLQITAASFEVDVETMSAAKMLARGFSSNHVLISLVAVLAAAVCACAIERVGRRRLLIAGALVMGICQPLQSVLMASACTGELFARECPSHVSDVFWYTLVPITAIAAFAMSWGPTCWTYPLELFPTELRARGFAVALSLSAAIALSVKEFGLDVVASPFVSVPCALAALALVWSRCPETKSLVLEVAEMRFHRDAGVVVR